MSVELFSYFIGTKGESVAHVEGALGRAESVSPAICIFAPALSQKA